MQKNERKPKITILRFLTKLLWGIVGWSFVAVAALGGILLLVGFITFLATCSWQECFAMSVALLR